MIALYFFKSLILKNPVTSNFELSISNIVSFALSIILFFETAWLRLTSYTLNSSIPLAEQKAISILK